MRRLLISCGECRRHSWLDFEGDARALEPLVTQKQFDHLVDEDCRGELVTATVERVPLLRLTEESARG